MQDVFFQTLTPSLVSLTSLNSPFPIALLASLLPSYSRSLSTSASVFSWCQTTGCNCWKVSIIPTNNLVTVKFSNNAWTPSKVCMNAAPLGFSTCSWWLLICCIKLIGNEVFNVGDFHREFLTYTTNYIGICVWIWWICATKRVYPKYRSRSLRIFSLLSVTLKVSCQISSFCTRFKAKTPWTLHFILKPHFTHPNMLTTDSVKTSNLNFMDSMKQNLIMEIINAFDYF